MKVDPIEDNPIAAPSYKTSFEPPQTKATPSNLRSGSKGAGAIFQTSWATTGYKFPLVRINEMDEKHLFDLEVNSLSLLHGSMY